MAVQWILYACHAGVSSLLVSSCQSPWKVEQMTQVAPASGLAICAVGNDGIGAGDTTDSGIVEPHIHVHEADVGQHLVAGIAACGLTGDAIGRIVGAVRMPPPAEGNVRQTLNHHTAFRR